MSEADRADPLFSAIGTFAHTATSTEAIVDIIFRCELRHLPAKKAGILSFELRNRTQFQTRRTLLKELLRTYEDQDLISSFNSLNSRIDRAFNFRNELLHNVIYRQEVTNQSEDFMEVIVRDENHPTGLKKVTQKRVGIAEITQVNKELLQINTELIALYAKYAKIVEGVDGADWRSKFEV